MIRLVNIKHFRSIRKLSLTTEEITTFVGKNDAGKSNILRALNLFFTNKTDSYKSFDFNSDFNIHADTYKQTAKEITVELVLKLPKSYRRDEHPDTVYWKKVWRKTGLHSEESNYCVLKNGRITKKTDFPPRSKIPFLLKSINFLYIPAVKDRDFFKELQGQLYDVLANSSDEGLHQSANGFETEINNHVSELMTDINSIFDGINDVRLPKNLRNIFGALEFNSDEIPLERRGDGIKIRHIPMMLSFIAHKQRNTGGRTAIRPQIWAFEEPENNVEFLTCFELNKQLVEAANQHTQVFITTHSPAIYSIDSTLSESSNLKAARYYVDKEGYDTTAASAKEDELHGHIGFLQLITPMIEKYQVNWKKDEANYQKTITNMREELDDITLPRLFVEGKSDKVVFDRLLKCCGELCHIDVPEEASNNSNAAKDRAIAFDLVQKHNKNSIKGFLLLDKDDAGNAAKLDFSVKKSQKNNVKCELLSPSQTLIKLLKNGFDVSVDLERLYPFELWKHAMSKNWLVEIECQASKFTEKERVKILNSDTTIQNIIGELSEYEQLLVNYNFSIQGKIKMSNYIKNMSDAEISDTKLINNFQPILDVIYKHLF